MSVRLFHRGGRVVLPLATAGDERRWLALHVRPVAWDRIFTRALALVGLESTRRDNRLEFRGGALGWTPGWFWTTIRLRLPPASPKKNALVSSGLLKAARYAEERSA